MKTAAAPRCRADVRLAISKRPGATARWRALCTPIAVTEASASAEPPARTSRSAFASAHARRPADAAKVTCANPSAARVKRAAAFARRRYPMQVSDVSEVRGPVAGDLQRHWDALDA